MSASIQYKSTTHSSYDNSCCGDEENYIKYSRTLKEEDDQIFITEETNDSFNEKRALIANNLSLSNNHEQAYQAQQQQLFAIKNLINPSSSQNQLIHNNEINAHQQSSFIHNQNLSFCNGSSIQNLNQSCQRSKKEILKEKRDKKKQQIQEKKIVQFEETNSDQSNLNDKKKEYTKEEKAERQRIKNRESAQLSRDRKKQQESAMIQDLNSLTEENKHLQSLIKQSYTCQQCGFFNNPVPSNEYSTCSSKQFNQKDNLINPDSIKHRCSSSFENNSQQLNHDNSIPAPQLSNPVYQFFDFSRTNTPLMQASPLNFGGFGKGVWSTTFVIFVLYMLLVFSGSQQDSNGTVGSSFRNLQLVGPYAQIFEQYKNFSQEQLLEELLIQIEKLKSTEREDQIQQLRLIQMIANATTQNSTNDNNTTTNTKNNNEEEASTTSELSQSLKASPSTPEENEKDMIIEESESQTSSSSTAANSALLEKIQALEKEIQAEEKPVQQGFLDFCKQYKEIQSANEEERSYYKDLSQKLDELQREKLYQLEQLKSIYCVSVPEVATISSSSEVPLSKSSKQQQQQFIPHKMEFPTTFFSEKQLFQQQGLNPSVLQESSIEKFQNTLTQQPQYDGPNYQKYNTENTNNNNYLNNNYNNPPTFDNISQFFNDTASFKDDEGMNSSLLSSQILEQEEINQNHIMNHHEEQYLGLNNIQQPSSYEQQQQHHMEQNMHQHNQILLLSEQEEQEGQNAHLLQDDENNNNTDLLNVISNVNQQKPNFNYYEYMQRKSNEQNQNQHNIDQQPQQISCQYSFQQQPHQIMEDYQNSNSTNNSIHLQNVQNGKVQQYNLLFTPHQNGARNNGREEQFFQNYDVEKYIKFSCKFVDNNCIKKDSTF